MQLTYTERIVVDRKCYVATIAHVTKLIVHRVWKYYTFVITVLPLAFS